jgi:hypothetical protein
VQQTLEVDVQPTGEVHPVAALFPMLPDDELRELADSIKANGQHDPIVLDCDGTLIDGRNRLRACKLVGIAPIFTTFEGDDPATFILDKNINRRHMSKGQQAMAVAKARVFLKNTSVREAGKGASVSYARIGYASTVLQYAPDLADGVLSGAIALNVAYDEAQRRKAASSSVETQLERVRQSAPDLADLVVEERMALREALAALDARVEEERRQRSVATRQVNDLLTLLESGATAPEDVAARWVALIDWRAHPPPFEVTRARLERAAAVMTGLVNGLLEAQ